MVVLVGWTMVAATPSIGGLRTVRVGRSPDAMAIDARTGHFFVVNAGQWNQNGSVSILDMATGRLLRTVRVGAAPDAVTVDGRHGRVYVVNAQSNTVSVLDAWSGRIVATLGPFSRTPMSAIAVVVDQTAGHAFISAVARRGPG